MINLPTRVVNFGVFESGKFVGMKIYTGFDDIDVKTRVVELGKSIVI